MTRWTLEQVAKVAPDQSSLAAARRLARPGPWSDTGSTETSDLTHEPTESTVR